MRQELAMIKTSPRLAIGYGNETVEAASPNKTISEAMYSIEGGPMVRQSME